MAVKRNPKMKYSVIRVVRKQGKKPLRFFVRNTKGQKIYGFNDYRRIVKRLKRAGLEHEVKYYLPKKKQPKPVPAPKFTVDEAHLAVVTGTNLKRGVVLHSVEGHDREGASDIIGVNAYLRRKRYGIHYIVDGEGNILRGAYHNSKVIHCAGANTTHLGIEMMGFARWDTQRWFWDPTATGRRKRKQIAQVIHLLAWMCDSEGIPIRHDKNRGISKHVDHPRGGHWDPGPGFPMRYVLRKAKQMQQEYRNPK